MRIKMLDEDHRTRVRRRRQCEVDKTHQRLDIQGLRMVAVLSVFACHLWHWPKGGFVGVDVFFVISGFLITGKLLRTAETTGTVSFRRFYQARALRIVPAATVVLVLTYLASLAVFMPFRAHQVGIDALFAFVFLSNWWFNYQGTDYFHVASQSVSPIQHYWSLSIEEQFYVWWPALIFLISVVVLRRAWTHERRWWLAGGVMAVIVAASFGWAILQTSTALTAAYFNTFSRIWELGVGALLATGVGVLAKIPHALKPTLSWGGLALIGASMFLIAEGAPGFPAPWAALPVAGAALVIAAGVGGEPRRQEFLRNKVSTYIGDISYSLYLVHWPIIIILGAVMKPSPYFYLAVGALAFGLAVASFHFIENPFRHATRAKIKSTARHIRQGRYHIRQSSKLAAVCAMGLVVVGATAFVMRPYTPPRVSAIEVATDTTAAAKPEPSIGPATAALRNEIADALKATDWPKLDPTMEAVIAGPEAAPEVVPCGTPTTVDVAKCSWGDPKAPTQIVVVGDSVALSYVGPLRRIALDSGSQIQVHTQALPGCQFVDDLIENPDQKLMDACPGRKQEAVDFINATKPTAVIIANSYGYKRVRGEHDEMTPAAWRDSVRRIVDKFRLSVGKVVMLSAPPADILIGECFGTRSSNPGDCISKVTRLWQNIAYNEQQLAAAEGGVWIDSRSWFCLGFECPSFAGITPTKHDRVHMAPEYGDKIYPAIQESFRAAGVF